VKFKLKRHTATVRDLAFAPNGKRLVTGSDDCRVIVWDTATGAHIASLAAHKQPLTSLAISRDGSLIATGGNNESNVNLWDADSGILLHSLDIGPAESLAFAPDNVRLAAAGFDGIVRVCQPDEHDSWSIAYTIQAHAHLIRDITWSFDGMRLASASADGTVKLWDTHSWREVSAIASFKEQVHSISFSADGTRLVIAARYEPLKICDLSEKQIVAQLFGHAALVTSVEYSPDGWRLISASEDGTVRLWDGFQSSNNDLIEGHRGHVRAVAFSPVGDMFASGGIDDALIILWNSATGKPIQLIRPTGISVTDLVFSPDGKHLASTHGWGRVLGRLIVWDILANRATLELPLSPRDAVGVAWSPDGGKLAVEAADGTILIFEVSSGRQLGSCFSEDGTRGGIVFSNDGKLLVSAGVGNSIRVWRSDTLTTIREFQGHTARVVDIAFNPQGTMIASSSEDYTIRLWDAASGKLLRTFSGHEGTPLALAFSTDGTRLASSCTDQTVKLWDVATGFELQTLDGHTNWVRDIAFSTDGRYLVSAGYDGVLRIWHAPTKFGSLSAEREAAALVRHLATRYSAREALAVGIKADETINEAVRAAALDQAEEFLFYWAPMLAGHRAAEHGDWEAAVDAFQRVVDLAPETAIHWYWLAMASLAGRQKETYQVACDELLGRFGPDRSVDDLLFVLKAWLVSSHDTNKLARLGPLVDTFAAQITACHGVPWLFKLRHGTIPRELLESIDPPAYPEAENWFAQAIACHAVGNRAKAVVAYRAGLRHLRLVSQNWYWDNHVFVELLRQEVEVLLGIESQ
jgi:WD40 repeat protein